MIGRFQSCKICIVQKICFILYPVSPLLQKNTSRTLVPAEDPHSGEQFQKLRRILLIAFGGLLLLLILGGLDALLSVLKLSRIEQEVTRRFTAHSQALSAITVSVHVYDDQMEQYLLREQEPTHATREFDAINRSAEIHAALQQYPLDKEPDEQVLIKELERGLAEQENSFAVASSWSAEDRHQRAHRFIGEQLIPQRTHIMQITQQISLLNGRKLGEKKEALAASFRSVQTRLQ